MNNEKQRGEFYKPIIKEGTHLAPSKKTPGAYRGTQLSDINNQVDGQTEWVKVDQIELDNDHCHDYTYQEKQNAVELTVKQKEAADALGTAIADVTIWILSEYVAPRVRSWWQEKAAPSLKKTWQGIAEKKKPQKDKGKQQLRATHSTAVIESVPGVFSQELDEAYEKYVNDMTSEEAQRELLDIFVLSAIVAAKMRKLANALIRDKGDMSGAYIDGKVVVEKLSTPEFLKCINTILESNPRLLEEKSAILAGILGRTLIVDGRYIPIENKALRAAFVMRIEMERP